MSYLCYIYIIIYRGKTKASRREWLRLDGLPSCPPRPRPLPSPLSGDKGNAEQKSKKKGRKRENQGEGCRRHLRQFLASLLLRLMSSPSTPSPAAHHFARLCHRSWRGTGGHFVRFWAMLSTPHRHTSPPIDQQQGSASTVCHHPRLVLVLFPPSGGEGRSDKQPGRDTPSRSPRRPSPPCRGAVRIRLLSSSYHLTIKAIPGRWSVFFKRGEALKYFFSAYQIINRKTRS